MVVCDLNDRQRILTELKRLALEMALDNPQGKFAFDDIRDALTEPLPDDFPLRALGTVMRDLSQAGAVKRVGYHISRVATNNGHAVGLWRLRSRVAAESLLASL